MENENDNETKKISKNEWKRIYENNKKKKIHNKLIIDKNEIHKNNFLEALFACDEMFVKDLHELIERAKEISCIKGVTFWDLKILSVLGNDTVINKNNYEIKGYSYISKDGYKRFFSTDVFIYGLHPKDDINWMSRHYDPWVEKNKVPGFWRVKMELENDENFPCWLIDDSNPDKSKIAFFKIFFDDIKTQNISIKNKNFNVNVYGDHIHWHAGNTIGSSFKDLLMI
jgi:hypothetical protein